MQALREEERSTENMSDLITQQQRRAASIQDASELVVRVKPDAERVTQALQELLLPDVDRLAALAYELSEMVVRQERALDHISDHVISAQEQEIRALSNRVEDLEELVSLRQGDPDVDDDDDVVHDDG